MAQFTLCRRIQTKSSGRYIGSLASCIENVLIRYHRCMHVGSRYQSFNAESYRCTALTTTLTVTTSSTVTTPSTSMTVAGDSTQHTQSHAARRAVPVGTIVGAIVGSLMFCATCVVVGCLFLLRRRRRQRPKKTADGTHPSFVSHRLLPSVPTPLTTI